MSIIAVDIGSSFTKFGWTTRPSRGLEKFLTVPNTSPIDRPLLQRILHALPGSHSKKSADTRNFWGISSVNPPRLKELRQAIADLGEDSICEIDYQQVPLLTEVEFPQQLGRDRLIAAWRATKLSSHRPLVIIDAGTAVTIDFVDLRGIHLGGLILPGMHVMLNSLGRQTHSLPDLTAEITGKPADQKDSPTEADTPVTTPTEIEKTPVQSGSGRVTTDLSEGLPLQPPLYGVNTFQAISCGVLQCQVAVLLSCTRQAREKWGVDPEVFLTGGGSGALRNYLPGDWQFHPDLVLSGIYEIAKSERAND
jgi:pantothenate kinase type III